MIHPRSPLCQAYNAVMFVTAGDCNKYPAHRVVMVVRGVGWSQGGSSRRSMSLNDNIMSRLTADGLIEKLAKAAAAVPKSAAERRRVEVTSRKGKLSPKTTDRRFKVYGRRAMSPYQAAAMGSGYGVLPARDIQYHPDPQRFQLGYGPSWQTSTGRSTINQEAPPSPFVHITFPEWVR